MSLIYDRYIYIMPKRIFTKVLPLIVCGNGFWSTFISYKAKSIKPLPVYSLSTLPLGPVRLGWDWGRRRGCHWRRAFCDQGKASFHMSHGGRRNMEKLKVIPHTSVP